MYKEGDEEHYGAMLMGMESDAHGVMNQMGHTHDIHATPEKASSFGGQRTDEVGNKYGGRQCDLSKKSARVCVLQAAADALIRQLPENVVLEIPTIADSSARLVQRLLSDSTATHMRRATLDLTGTEAV